MGKLIITLALGFGLYLAAPASSVDADIGALPELSIATSFDSADSFVGWGDFWSWLNARIAEIKAKLFGGGDGIRPGGGNGAAVPELDMTVAGSALVLLLGGVAYMISRRREQE